MNLSAEKEKEQEYTLPQGFIFCGCEVRFSLTGNQEVYKKKCCKKYKSKGRQCKSCPKL